MFTCVCDGSSSGDGRLSAGTSELLVQSEGLLPGQDNGGHALSGEAFLTPE